MLLDMQMWKDKDLGDVARKMENIERRLDIARGGPETQRQQREVLNRLDEIIKKLENDKKPPGPPGPPGPGDQPGKGKGPPKSNDPSDPADEIGEAPNMRTTGENEFRKFANIASEFGRLPPREQHRVLQELTAGMSPRHREAIENYFRSLTNPNPKR
jgi:hypothetical protein